jgi:hypothetical protein
MTSTGRKILQAALDFVTQREIAGNQGFVDPKFEELMKLTGWRQGQAWCAYFAELVVKTAGFEEHAKVFSGSAVETYKNCVGSPLFMTYEIPAVGDIAIWQNYSNNVKQWTGHAGIVVGMGRGLLITVEGNTDSEGGREGIEVALKLRDPVAVPTTGLRLLGFIRIRENESI